MEYLLYLLTGLTAVLLVLVILLLVRQNRTVRDQEAEFDRLAEELRRQQTVSAGELSRLKMELGGTQWAAAPNGYGQGAHRQPAADAGSDSGTAQPSGPALCGALPCRTNRSWRQLSDPAPPNSGFSAMQRQNAEKLDEGRGVADEKSAAHPGGAARPSPSGW